MAEAARRAKEQKKTAAKPAKVITNDSLPAAPAQSSEPAAAETQSALSPNTATQATTSAESAPATIAPTAAASSEAAAQSAGAPDTAATPVAGQPVSAAQADKAQTNPQVAALKRQIADQQKQVELLMRLYALDQDAFLSNPDHAKDPQGKAKLDAQKEEIHTKVAEVARLKEKLEVVAPGESAKIVAPKP